MSSKRVLLIGWDAADWKVINPLLERGELPALQRFMDEGAWGNLATLHPILSPMLWTSIATGKRPQKHGIHGFIEPLSDGQGVRASTSTTRTCKAVWNIASQSGLRTNAISWFCSHPAEPINGVCVSEMFDHVKNETRDEWALLDDTVHPPELAETMAEYRLHPSDVLSEQLLPFVPKAAQVDQEKDHRLAGLAVLISKMVNAHSAATWAMEHKPWDLMCVYNQAIDHFCHNFMQYHPPKLPGISETDFELYQNVIASCYRFHDMMLARMMELAGSDTTVVICSDHGFHSDHLRPGTSAKVPGGAAQWHREYGIVCLRGPDIQTGSQVYGASILDIVPTVLTLLGLPVANDMDGNPMVSALKPSLRKSIKRIDTWEDVSGNAGMHPPEKRDDPFGSAEAIQQLVDLGYIEQSDVKAERAAAKAKRDAQFNLGQSHLAAGEFKKAIQIFGPLWEEHRVPQDGLQLAKAHLAKRRTKKAREYVEQVLQLLEERAAHSAKLVTRRRNAVDEHLTQLGDATESPEDAERQQRRKRLEQADKRLSHLQNRLESLDVRALPRVRLLQGALEMVERRTEQAMEHFLAAEKHEPQLPGLHIQIGYAYLRLRRWPDALRAFNKALDIDGDNPFAHNGKASALLRFRENEQALEHALIAAELRYYFPKAHYNAGVALRRTGRLEEAIDALNVCSKLAPRAVSPHKLLVKLHEQRQNLQLMSFHLSQLELLQKKRKSKKNNVGKQPPATSEN